MFGLLAATVSIFWQVLNGATYQACYKEGAQAQVCAAANGTGKHDFPTLKDDTDYNFSYKQNGVESDLTAYHTQKKTPAAPSLTAQP